MSTTLKDEIPVQPLFKKVKEYTGIVYEGIVKSKSSYVDATVVCVRRTMTA